MTFSSPELFGVNMRKVATLAMLLAIASAAGAAEAPIPMRPLLNSGFRVVTAIAGRLILQKDDRIFSCGHNISGPQMAISGDIIYTTYICVPLH